MVTSHITYRHRRATQKHDIRNKKHHVKTTARSTSTGIVLQTVSQTPKRVIGQLSFSPRKRRRTLPHLTPVDDDDDESTDGDHAEEYTPFVLPSKGTYTQNDFMNDWVEVKDVFLEELLNHERPLLDMQCELCSLHDNLWRCLSRHSSLPFHRVEIWRDTHFEPSWLWKTGLVVHLGHHGQPCPTSEPLDGSDPDHPFHDNDPGEFHWEVAEDDFTTRLLASGLYPASLKDIRTVATFPLLDDHHMSTVECHTSTYSFYNCLCRVTNKAFPQTVPWLHLKELKWFGFGHLDKAPGPGSLAMFCAGCPQPGINISAEDWKALTDVPKRQRADDDDVWLKKGYSFMTERHRYQSHLEVALESKQHSNVPRGTKIVLCYDINCLWHVHGHRPECYPRHAPSFVYGAARKSSEILESLWDTLNPITGCTRTMTNAHRVEVLDAVMADSNWKKLTGLVVSITRDVVRARIEAGASADEFDTIDASISAEHHFSHPG
ncbi:hypothetical protein BKA70DRAFT_1231504 [Coprinopsis sp. MPI-PUGE-AT-0042]|nr:hypothetical protein BKA70DRAFT_1231504 [Coprinopsis sp. MPI-PUGE-AT-0042]